MTHSQSPEAGGEKKKKRKKRKNTVPFFKDFCRREGTVTAL